LPVDVGACVNPSWMKHEAGARSLAVWTFVAKVSRIGHAAFSDTTFYFHYHP